MPSRPFPAGRPLAAVLLATAALVAGCGDSAAPATDATARMGAGRPQAADVAPLQDAQGRAIPPPPLPRGTEAQIVRAGPETVLAVWVQDGHVTAARHQPDTGWSAGEPLEGIYGEASDARLASNGRGAAMAVWRHTVGVIESLRFSHWQADGGWSPPDVLPGALPRPRTAGASAAPQLEMDAAGHAYAHWASGFDPLETQSARFTAGSGWTRALSEPVAAAPAAPADTARPGPQAAGPSVSGPVR